MSTPGTERIAAERQRQIEQEGYTLDHDAHHHPAELVEAAIAYASPNDGVALWPWDPAGFRPEVRAADLAGVLGHLRHGSDTYMGRTVTATGVMTGLHNVGRDVVLELRVRADEVVQVAKK